MAVRARLLTANAYAPATLPFHPRTRARLRTRPNLHLHAPAAAAADDARSRAECKRRAPVRLDLLGR